MCGKGMDDRAGLAILIQSLVELKEETPFGCVQAIGNGSGAGGTSRAAMAAYRNQPDYAIAIDGLPASDTPDLSTTDVSVTMGTGGGRVTCQLDRCSEYLAGMHRPPGHETFSDSRRRRRAYTDTIGGDRQLR